MADMGELRREAREWNEADPDPETHEAWERFRATASDTELAERMQPLEFGTAGLRAEVGAGPARMNEAVVRRAALAVAQEVLEAHGTLRKVIVGYDARISSYRFAQCAARVVAAAGLEVSLFSDPVPTPLVAYAARKFNAAAAIVITASHNPREYNGVKVYGPDAAPITQQWEQALSIRLRTCGPACAIPIAPPGIGRAHDRIGTLSVDDFFDEYLKAVALLRCAKEQSSSIRIVYSALHGVGGKYVLRALNAFGHREVDVVPEQFVPDGHFPTLDSPNPEDPSALRLALALADRAGAELVLANDPDADRLAVAVRTRSGGWQILSGNQVGVLLADELLSRSELGDRALVVSTIVSSPMTQRVASRYGARFETTLTGFKWLCAAALQLSKNQGYTPVLAFEEAIGFSPGTVVRDKDGISSAVLIADIAAFEAGRGCSLLDRLRELHAEHGLWVSSARSWMLPGDAGVRRMQCVLDELVSEPPSELGGVKISGLHDWREVAPGSPPWLGSTELVELKFERGRILVRPSGTEPKLKAYVDFCAPGATCSHEAERDALQTAERMLVDFGEKMRLGT